MQPLNFSSDPWRRSLDFYDSMLDYEINLPSIPSDHFSSTTPKWLRQGKLLLLNQKIFVNKEAFKSHSQDGLFTYPQRFTKKKKKRSKKRKRKAATATAFSHSKNTTPSVTFPMTQLPPVWVTLSDDLTGSGRGQNRPSPG